MQTRKRAKPVQFGKKKEETEKKEEKEEKNLVTEQEESSVKETKKEESELSEENHSASKEITQKNIAESIEEAREDDEPEAISLSAPSVDQAKQEESFDKNQDEAESQSKAIEETRSKQAEEKPEPQSSFGSFTMQNAPKKKKGSLGFFLLVVIIAFLIGLGGMLGFSYIKDGDMLQKISELTETPTPTPRPTNTPTPTPTEKVVNKGAYTIAVLNGSGISGLAAKTESALVDAGFKVASKGNADNSDYTNTIVAAKKSVDEEYLKELTNELEKSYKVDIAVKTLPANAGTDVEVTLGSATAE